MIYRTRNALLGALICSWLLLTACTNPSDELVGNWKMNLGLSTGNVQGDYGVDLIIGFRSDGSFTFTGFVSAEVTGDTPFSEHESGKWKLEESVLTLYDASGAMIYRGYLSWSYDRQSFTIPNPPTSPMYFDKM